MTATDASTGPSTEALTDRSRSRARRLLAPSAALLLSAGVVVPALGASGASAADDATGSTVGYTSSFAVLSGASEVPGPGDPDGRGAAIVRSSPRAERVCGSVVASRIDTPTAAHIHRGNRRTAGPIVVDLTAAVTTGEVCVHVDRKLASEIKRHPERFYVNVHNAAYPSGAVRGQLQQ